MRAALLCEGEIGGEWMPLAAQCFGMPPATMSDISTGTRQVYVTLCFSDHATISLMPLGVDSLKDVRRIIFAHDLVHAVLVKRLEVGESHVMTLQPDRAPKPMPIRWRCVMTERA